MGLNDVTIIKVDGGLGRREPQTDMVTGLLVNGIAVSGGAQLGTIYELGSVADAISLGLDAAYDEANDLLVYEHIKEFFRINANGTLWLMLVAKTVTFADMVDPTIAVNAKKLLIGANGEINQLAVAYNPTTPVVDDTALLAALAKAQTLVSAEFLQHRPIHVLLEGKGANIASLSDLRALNAAGVSVMTGQNKTVAASKTSRNTYGAVGTLAGAVSLARVNESVAWIQKFNVLGDNLNDFGISNIESALLTSTQLSDANDKGYLFFTRHAGIAGVYLNDSHSSTAITGDYSTIENNRTVNKAARLIRRALLPFLGGPIQVNPDTGRLSPEVVKSLEETGNKAIEEGMLKNAELSGFTFTIDENQNVLSTSELETQLSLVPTGTARKIIVKIGFSNPFA